MAKQWRVVEGFNRAGELLGYYVIYGSGNDPTKVTFTRHGRYLLRSAAKEDAESYNDDMKNPNVHRISCRGLLYSAELTWIGKRTKRKKVLA